MPCIYASLEYIGNKIFFNPSQKKIILIRDGSDWLNEKSEIRYFKMNKNRFLRFQN